MEIKTELLKPYEFNKEFFEDIKGSDYDALKEDIKQNGIKVELHITKSNTILCGHQRWEIAKELGLKQVPVKVVNLNEEDDKKVKEYVIKDNLLRRHLSTEQKYILIATLSEVYESPEPKRDSSGKFTVDATMAHTEERDDSGYVKPLKDATVASTRDEDVLTKTAKDTGVGEVDFIMGGQI